MAAKIKIFLDKNIKRIILLLQILTIYLLRAVMSSEVQLPSINNLHQSSKRRIVVCRGRSCRKYNADRVFENFKQNLPAGIDLISVPCLGQCGNGSMVLVEPELIWYSQVHPDEVAVIIKQHIMGNVPVKEMLYPKFHRKR